MSLMSHDSSIVRLTTGIVNAQITWFLAFVTLDQRRIKGRRNALIPCIVHKDWTPSEWSRTDYGAIISQKFSNLLYSRLFRDRQM